MIYTFTSSKAVIAKLFRDLKGLYTSDLISDSIEWIGEAIEEMGLDGQTSSAVMQLDSSNHRASLPCDMVKLNQVANYTDNVIPAGTDTFGYDENTVRQPLTRLSETFKIEGGYIKTQSESLTFFIDYERFSVDEDGYPMIPSHQYCIQACTYYVIMKLIERGLIHPTLKLVDSLQLYISYKNKARSKLAMPDRARWETFKTNYLRLIPNINFRAEQFYSSGGFNGYLR